jgi:hypothetical protein
MAGGKFVLSKDFESTNTTGGRRIRGIGGSDGIFLVSRTRDWKEPKKELPRRSPKLNKLSHPEQNP